MRTAILVALLALVRPACGADLTYIDLQTAAESGKWKISEDVSKIDDGPVIVVRLDAEAGVKSGYRENWPSLIIRLEEGEVDAYVAFGFFLGSDSIPVTIRFGEEQAVNEEWSTSTNGKAVFAPNSAKFLAALVKCDLFRIRITPYGESPVLAEFDVRQLNTALEPMRKAYRASAKPTQATPATYDPLQAIRAKAAKEWPKDFAMQEYVIKREVEAYNRLHPEAPIVLSEAKAESTPTTGRAWGSAPPKKKSVFGPNSQMRGTMLDQPAR